MPKDNREKINISTKLKKIITAYAYKMNITKNEAHRQSIRGLYDDIPKALEKDLLDIYESLTDEQRKYPHK